MKSLKLTILLEQGLSKAELANTFGGFKEIHMSNRYVQFSFPSVIMLTPMQLKPIHDLVSAYEKTKALRFKCFHLFDEEDQTYSPIALYCYRGLWTTVSMPSGTEMKSSTNLFTLF